MLPLVEPKRISMLMPATFELVGVAAAYLIEACLDAKRICGSVGLDRFADIDEIGITLTVQAIPGSHLLKSLEVFVVEIAQAACVHGEQIGRAHVCTPVT